MTILESARAALLDPHLDASPADVALMRRAEVAVFEEQVRADERARVRGVAGTHEGGEDSLEGASSPEPRCNGVDTGCTGTPNCPVHMERPS